MRDKESKTSLTSVNVEIKHRSLGVPKPREEPRNINDSRYWRHKELKLAIERRAWVAGDAESAVGGEVKTGFREL